MAKVRHYFYLDDQRDVDVLAWLQEQPNRSLAVRRALRAWRSHRDGLDEAVLRRVLREELARVSVSRQEVGLDAPQTSHEDEKVAEALDSLMEIWSDLDAGDG